MEEVALAETCSTANSANQRRKRIPSRGSISFLDSEMGFSFLVQKGERPASLEQGAEGRTVPCVTGGQGAMRCVEGQLNKGDFILRFGASFGVV